MTIPSPTSMPTTLAGGPPCRPKGAYWAAIELAKALPHIRVDGMDNDEASVANHKLSLPRPTIAASRAHMLAQ